MATLQYHTGIVESAYADVQLSEATMARGSRRLRVGSIGERNSGNRDHLDQLQLGSACSYEEPMVSTSRSLTRGFVSLQAQGIIIPHLWRGLPVTQRTTKCF